MGTPALPERLASGCVSRSFDSEMADETAFGSFNSDKGIGPGWRLHAGPSSSGKHMPIEVETVDNGVRVRFRGGGTEFFPDRGNRSYRSTGGGSGVVAKTQSGGYSYTTADGDYYAFDSTGNLTTSKPVSTKAKASLATNPNYRYSFDNNGRLQWVKDPIDRQVTFTWATEAGQLRLQTVQAWDGHTWQLDYYTDGNLKSILTPASETLYFKYTTHTPPGGVPSSFLTEVQNGQQYADVQASKARAAGWRIAYTFDSAPALDFEVWRAQYLTPPGGATDGEKWMFTYGSAPADYEAWTSLDTIVRDPRGGEVNSPAGDYETAVHFNTSGYPVQIDGPVKNPSDPNNDPVSVTRMQWDSHGQLLCRREAAANSIGSSCTSSSLTDDYNTEYVYQVDEPFRLTKMTNPKPQSGATRTMESYEYDDGNTFQGLWTQRFQNENLSGIPDDEGLWGESLNHNWGTGSPGSINGNDTWSLRLTGFLDISSWNQESKSVQWQVTSDDGAALVVGDEGLMDCVGATAGGSPIVNCGLNNPPKMKLIPGTTGMVPITIEFAEQTGSAQLKVEWKLDNRGWNVVPLANLKPNLGLMTSKVVGPDWGGSNTALQMKTIWTYPDDNAKARRLPEARKLRDVTTGIERKTAFTYDDFGRRTHITKFADTVDAAETVRTFTDSVNNQTSCMTKVVDPEGGETDYDCNESGDVIETDVVIRAVTGLQTAETRTETTTYDEMGRPTRVEHAGPGVEKFAYDLAGRTTSHSVLLAGTGISSDPWAVTGTSYVDYPSTGNLTTMTETQPDPDRTGSLTSPTITHTYDWVGNETSHTDPRTAALWSTTYDAQNRVTSTSTPDPDGAGGNPALVTSTKYIFGASGGDGSDATITFVTSPDGSTTRITTDVLGRTTSSNTGYLSGAGLLTFTTVLAPTNTCYDEVGNVNRTEVRTSGTACTGSDTNTVTWSESDHDAWGGITDERRPWFDGSQVNTVTTTSTYYTNTGLLKRVQGPLTDDANHKDQMDYVYDLNGQLTSVTTWTKAGASPESFTTAIKYNDAGERLRIKSDLTADATKQQVRTFTYTKTGHVEQTTEDHGSSSPLGTNGVVTMTNGYDVAGRLVTVSDPRGFVQRFDYDDLGRETARCQVANTTTACSGTGSSADEIDTSYNADGSVDWLRRGTTTSGRRYDLVYDTANRMTKITPKTGTTADTANRTETTFNSLGQVSTLKTPASSTTIAYVYYAAGQSGGSIGLLKSITDPFTSSATTWTYDGAGRVTGRTDPAGLSWTRLYEAQSGQIDTQKILKTSNSKTYEWIDLGYDQAGDVSSRIEKLWKNGATGTSGAGDSGTGSWSYGYDGAGRMTSASGPDQTGTSRTWTYGYDGMGDRTSLAVAGVSTTTTTDLQGWPTRSDPGTPGNNADDTTFAYDEVGDLTAIDDLTGVSNDRTFAYDTWSLTKAATAGSTSLTYGLDPYGRTITRQVGSGPIVDYRYVGTTETLASDGTTAFVYGPSAPLINSGGSSNKVLLDDLHGDVVGTFATGTTAMSEEYWYSPYGRQETLAGGALALGYQGDLSDSDSDAIDMGTRQYMPTTGRFTSRDALFGEPSKPISLNQFVYALGSPIQHVDPTGMSECDYVDCEHHPGRNPNNSSDGGGASSDPSGGDSTDYSGSDEPVNYDCYTLCNGSSSWWGVHPPPNDTSFIDALINGGQFLLGRLGYRPTSAEPFSIISYDYSLSPETSTTATMWRTAGGYTIRADTTTDFGRVNRFGQEQFVLDVAWKVTYKGGAAALITSQMRDPKVPMDAEYGSGMDLYQGATTFPASYGRPLTIESIVLVSDGGPNGNSVTPLSDTLVFAPTGQWWSPKDG